MSIVGSKSKKQFALLARLYLFHGNNGMVFIDNVCDGTDNALSNDA